MSTKKNQEENEVTTFTPVIQGTDVIALKINDRDFLMREIIDVKNFFEELLPLFQRIDNYFDFDQITSISNDKDTKSIWNFKTLKIFWLDLSEIQKRLLEIIFAEKKILRKDLVSKLFRNSENSESIGFNKKLAGISASITRKWNQKKLTPLWIIRRNYYEINIELYPIIKELMEKRRNFYDNG